MIEGAISRRSFVAATAAAAAAGVVKGRWGARHAEAADALTAMTLREAADGLRARRVSSVDLTRACLARIEKAQPVVNAFITVAADQALAEARQRDDDLRAGRWRGPLHGVPIALKDNIDTVGLRTTGASAVAADRVPTEDAEVVRRLKAAGAVILGKLNMDEFAAGGTGTVTFFGPARNPWVLERSTGGSSSGAGAAVAAGLCFGALGTDTTGSLRIPAAFCGVVGLKPTYGRVSASGLIPLSWTLDHVGPIGRTVEDAAIMLATIAGHDPLDSASVDVSVPDYLAEMQKVGVAALRVGVPRAPFFDRLDPEVAAATRGALGVLRRLVGSMGDVALPAVVPVPLVTDEEMYAYHADWFARVPQLYEPSTRRALDGAAKITVREYIDARRETERLRRAVRAVFDTVDVLVTPTVKIQPRTIEEAIKRSESGTPLPVELSNTSPFNVFGLPAITVPCGFTSLGLPVGLQIVGPHFGEARVLAVARAYEQATEWHRRRPPDRAP